MGDEIFYFTQSRCLVIFKQTRVLLFWAFNLVLHYEKKNIYNLNNVTRDVNFEFLVEAVTFMASYHPPMSSLTTMWK